MSSSARSPWVFIALRIAVGLVFVAASLDKLAHPDRFYNIIMAYQIVPWSTAVIMAIWLPWLEVAVGVVVMRGIWVRASALLLGALTFVFIVAIASTLVRGIDVACGCFTVSTESVARTWGTMWQEGALLAACLWLWWGYWPRVEEGPTEAEVG